jgi:hypothetical protein
LKGFEMMNLGNELAYMAELKIGLNRDPVNDNKYQIDTVVFDI